MKKTKRVRTAKSRKKAHEAASGPAAEQAREAHGRGRDAAGAKRQTRARPRGPEGDLGDIKPYGSSLRCSTRCPDRGVHARPVARAAFFATRLSPAPVFRTALFADLMAFVVLDFLRLALFIIPPVPRFVQLGSFSISPRLKSRAPPTWVFGQYRGLVTAWDSKKLPSSRTRPVTTLVQGSRKPP
jgi:hypothetical protein